MEPSSIPSEQIVEDRDTSSVRCSDGSPYDETVEDRYLFAPSLQLFITTRVTITHDALNSPSEIRELIATICWSRECFGCTFPGSVMMARGAVEGREVGFGKLSSCEAPW